MFSSPRSLTLHLFTAVISLLLFWTGCSPQKTITTQTTGDTVIVIPVEQTIRKICREAGLHRAVNVDSIFIREDSKQINVILSKEAAFFAFRESSVQTLTADIQKLFADSHPGYRVSISSAGYLLEEYIPNYYRSKKEEKDLSRMPNSPPALSTPVIRNASKPLDISNGLFNRNIVLWHSHGWYYSNDQKRWEWQRPRLFEAVEDLVPASIVLPYLVPMLQNAGANVWLPRERSTQLNEVVVDNDPEHIYAKGASKFTISGTKASAGQKTSPGFSMAKPVLDSSDNPFTAGSYLRFPSSRTPDITVSYIPEIPESGLYPVYISYHGDSTNATDAEYTVYHTGGKTKFLINQTIGGKTWMYLGDFHFTKGIHPDSGRVEVSSVSAFSGRYITADAVRFGAGYGNVARSGSTSNMPKYIEGARYWLQYAGMPDTLVYNLNRGRRDYNDDYQSRAEYANYLYGAPYGPNRDKSNPGLKIPIDLSLAFHTDAGITKNDSIIGTLLIYSTLNGDSTKFFPDGISRMANRDFADILQTQIVEDLRLSFDTAWTRRELRDAEYSEAWRPNLPGALLELLSHQNFADMILFKDPAFRFTVGRAIYKGMLRFLSSQYNIGYTVQPLPVNDFSVTLQPNANALLTWSPAIDELEPTAAPSGYIVYTAQGNGGYDNGTYTSVPTLTIKLSPDRLYRFKVTAVNSGGESFGSPELIAYAASKPAGQVALIDGFSRISGPLAVRSENFAGFLSHLDPGVPGYYDLSFTGYQYDFTQGSDFITNDRPGHGASATDYEKQVKRGNEFNNLYESGLIYTSLGYSVSSSIEDALNSGSFNTGQYKLIELVYEKQKTTKLPGRNSRPVKYSVLRDSVCARLQNYLTNGGALILSGEYLGQDIYNAARTDTLAKKFAADFLKWRWGASYALNHTLKPVSGNSLQLSNELSLDLTSSAPLMNLRSADSFYPVQGSEVLYRYAINDFAAMIAFKKQYKVLTLGFPLSKLQSVEAKKQLIKKFIAW